MNLSDSLSFDMREGFDEGIKLVNLSVKLVVTMVQETILDCQYFISIEAARIINVVTFLEYQKGSMALSCNNILLNWSTLNMDLHVSHYDFIARISA